MRVFLWLLLIFGYELAQSRPELSDSTIVSTNSDASASVDSIHGLIIKQSNKMYKQNYGNISIIVNPQEASDAELTVIQKSIIYYQPDFDFNSDLPHPDTTGKWKAPLNLLLYEGDYDIIAKKEGFKEATRTINIRKNYVPNISMDLFSLTYLQNKRQQWQTIKWVSITVAIGAGIASYYYKNKIDTYKTEYYNAISTDIIKDKRNRINQYQRYYHLSSIISFTALGSFGLSWFIEGTYE